MGYRCQRARYVVGVDGHFLDGTRYAIHAVVRYLPGVSESERASLAHEAQIELLLSIVGESERGRDLGARQLHVNIEGDRDLAGFFRAGSERPHPADIA